MSDMTINELERLVDKSDRGRRERQEDREAMGLCDELERLDREAAADRVEAVLFGWKDRYGRPLQGFESPRFTTQRQRDYIEWIQSPAGARTRRNVHPRLYDQMERG